MSDWDGWVVEFNDPIFDDLVYHEKCVDEDEDVSMADGPYVTITANSDNPALVDVVSEYRCLVCGATVQAREQQPVDYFLEDRSQED